MKTMKSLSLLSISLGAYLENVAKKKREKTKSDIAYYTIRENCVDKISECEFFIKSHILPLKHSFIMTTQWLFQLLTHSLCHTLEGTGVFKDISSHTHVYRHSTRDILIFVSFLHIFFLSVSSREKEEK
jgi:hypothetical protein